MCVCYFSLSPPPLFCCCCCFVCFALTVNCIVLYCQIKTRGLLLLIFFFNRLWVLIVRFISVQDGIYAHGKTHMRSTRSPRSYPLFAFVTVPKFVSLSMCLYSLSLYFSSCQGRSFSASSSHTSLLQAIYGVMLWLFVPAGSVSSSSTFQTVRYASHL